MWKVLGVVLMLIAVSVIDYTCRKGVSAWQQS